ncbi:hypothetical protein Agub_g3468, partial [Astrephomene gubernaculifera]
MAAYDEAVKAKVLKQVEFYFSDSNLPKDKFLKEKIAEDPEGYVAINVIAAFGRMRDTLKLTATTPAEVPEATVAAVADMLSGSSSLQLDESKTKIKRKEPLANEAEIARAVDARSIYARPFPMDATVDAITEFFSGHAPVNCVRMRRHMRSKMFKGSVFVEFASLEDAEKVMAQSLEFAGAPIRMLKKMEYVESKRQQRKNRSGGFKNDGDLSDDSNIGNGLPDGVGGVVDCGAVTSSHGQRQQQQQAKRAPKRKQEEEPEEEREYDEGDLGDGPSAKRTKPAPKETAEDGAAAGEAEGGDEEMGEGEEGGDAEQAQPYFTAGCLIGFTLEAELPELTGPRVISDVFGGRDKVRFVELNADRKGGYLRFVSPEFAAAALSDFEARGEEARTIAGIKGTMKKVEGEEEASYHKR